MSGAITIYTIYGSTFAVVGGGWLLRCVVVWWNIQEAVGSYSFLSRTVLHNNCKRKFKNSAHPDDHRLQLFNPFKNRPLCRVACSSKTIRFNLIYSLRAVNARTSALHFSVASPPTADVEHRSRLLILVRRNSRAEKVGHGATGDTHLLMF